MILIVSQSLDFAAPLAEQVKNVLSEECVIVENNESAKPLSESAALIITTEKSGKYSCPVMRINPDQAPFRMQKLLAQASELLHKHASPEGMALGAGLVLQPRSKQLQHGSASVDLTDKEMQLLQSLAKAGRQGISKEQLLKNVWGHDSPLDTHTLETHIYRLRGKIREIAGDEIIAASEGGYKLEL